MLLPRVYLYVFYFIFFCSACCARIFVCLSRSLHTLFYSHTVYDVHSFGILKWYRNIQNDDWTNTETRAPTYEFSHFEPFYFMYCEKFYILFLSFILSLTVSFPILFFIFYSSCNTLQTTWKRFVCNSSHVKAQKIVFYQCVKLDMYTWWKC